MTGMRLRHLRSNISMAMLAIAAVIVGLVPLVNANAATAATTTCPSPTVSNVPCVITAVNDNSTALPQAQTTLAKATVGGGKYSMVATAVIFNSIGPGEP